MAKRVKRIRHVEAEANNFTGVEGEVTVDLTNKSLRVHDETTKGGFQTARSDLANVASATNGNDGKMTATQVSNLETVIAGLAQEIIDRASAVAAEEARALVAEALNATNISNEITNRIADVDAEEARALAAEGVLQGNIDSEATTRGLADTALASADTTLQSNIDAEAAARIAADALLIPLTQKAAASGVASLDGVSKVIQTALNADAATLAANASLLDNKAAGNADGNIPISNGSICTNLNAQIVNNIRFWYGTGNTNSVGSGGTATATVTPVDITNAYGAVVFIKANTGTHTISQWTAIATVAGGQIQALNGEFGGLVSFPAANQVRILGYNKIPTATSFNYRILVFGT